MTSRPFHRIAALAFAAALSVPAFAQEAPPAADPTPAPPPSDTEEIVVTGSYIKGTPEDAALPVDVTSFDDLQEQGAPSVAELVRNLAYTSGNLAETNQFNAGGGGQAQEGVLTINLRGLGSARTLVLINGRRLAPSDAIGSDLSILPKSAIGRLEVLKDGAAALYGSDAIGGVANFITRENFEGFEVSASEQFIRKSGGDHEVALIGGWGDDRLHLMGAFEWSHRSELPFRDRGWAVRPQPENPQGGWSGIGNPARILPAFDLTANGLSDGTIIGAGGPDPRCSDLGGAVVGSSLPGLGGSCQFQFTRYDNLTEEQDNYKGYVEANFEISDSHKLHVEGIYGYMDMSNFKTSPSYPPQSLFGPDRFISASHPALVAFKAQYPTFFQPVGAIPAAAQGAYVLNRSLGVAGFLGKPQTGKRFTEQWRVLANLTGDLTDSIGYEAALTYARRDRRLSGFDMYVERMAFALDGLGGPNCNQSTAAPGSTGCLYYNPFSTSIQRSATNGVVNPDYNAAVANDPEMIRWLYGEQKSRTRNELFVFDAVLDGTIPWFSLPGGEIGWAAGSQVRREWYDFDVNDLTNLEVSPCPFNNARSAAQSVANPLGMGNVTQANYDACQQGLVASPTGPLAFLAGTYEQTDKRTIYAFFGELQLPFFDTLNAQLAVRYENYGGSVGSTTDPKLALQWEPLEWLKFRGSVSTTFRGPPQSFLGGRGTSLQFVGPANAFKAVDTNGNPNLKPESALTSNVGAIFEWEGLYASVDYWRFKFEDPFQIESFGQIVGAYVALGCQTGGADLDPTRCAGLRAHIFPTGITASQLERVEVNFINGSEINTSGIDFYLQYEIADLFGGTLILGSTGTYRIEYTSKDFLDNAGILLNVGGDFNGLLNDNTSPFQPLPEFKSDTFVKFNRGIHSAQVVGHYTTDYTDIAPSLAALGKIGSFFVVDMHYVVRLFEESTTLSFSILNVGDKNPPRASTDLNYDPFTHDGRGRMFKVGLTYSWTPE